MKTENKREKMRVPYHWTSPQTQLKLSTYEKGRRSNKKKREREKRKTFNSEI